MDDNETMDASVNKKTIDQVPGKIHNKFSISIRCIHYYKHKGDLKKFQAQLEWLEKQLQTTILCWGECSVMVDLISGFKEVNVTFQIKFQASCPDLDRLLPLTSFII